MRKEAIFILIFALITACSSKINKPVRVACSANAVEAINAIALRFSQETGIDVEIIPGSSGNLTAQINHGAPYDIFISANSTYPEKLHQDGLTSSNVRVYALGVLVLWTHSKFDPLTPDVLKNPDIERIAVANPRFAPYGLAAMQALSESGLSDKIENKLIYGESITQVNQFILSGAADAGLTAKSAVLSNNNSKVGSWIEIGHDLYTPIEQAAVLLKQSPESGENARIFYDYLFADGARSVLEEYGYLLPAAHID